MKLRIRPSSLMDTKQSPLGSVEDRLIRIPQVYREKLGLMTGLFLDIKTAINTIALQVSIAYKEDVERGSEVAYVSSNTYNLLRRNKIISVAPASDVMLGCDPEFHLVDGRTGFAIPASHFFPHYGEIGNDCGLAELRPMPSSNPIKVTAHINVLLRKVYNHIIGRGILKKHDIVMLGSSHCNNMSAGFHIHFGLPKKILRASKLNWLDFIVDILDYYVGVSAILPEGNDDYVRRSERFSRYGKPGDYRWDQMTLEYRVPGGHLLRHPIYTHGILSISKIVMNDLLSRLAYVSDNFNNELKFNYDDIRMIYPSIPDKGEVKKAIVSEKIDGAVAMINNIVNDLTKMLKYKEEKLAILNYYKYAILNVTGKKKFSANLKYNWRLVDERQQKQMEIHN